MNSSTEHKPQNGYGTYDFNAPDRERYAGEWKNGKRDGFGMSVTSEIKYHSWHDGVDSEKETTYCKYGFWKDDRQTGFFWKKTESSELDAHSLWWESGVDGFFVSFANLAVMTDGKSQRISPRQLNDLTSEYPLGDGSVIRVESDGLRMLFIGVFRDGVRNGMGTEYIYGEGEQAIDEVHGFWEKGVLTKRLLQDKLVTTEEYEQLSKR